MKTMISFINISILSLLLACAPNNPDSSKQNPYDQQLREYWYNGEAELSSYELKQARYGEMRDGKAVMIFVTEDFSTKTNTKADNPSTDNISVLKLNATRKFNTGVYPYSMMNSTFIPFPSGGNSIKVSTSSQEWCGHTYLELIDNGDFNIQNASYFQSEAQKEINLKKDILEDDLWSLIRINPAELPTGKLKIIPSFFYLRFSHNDIKAYDCVVSLTEESENMKYTISYPALERNLEIVFENQFPFRVLGWEDTYYSGWGAKKQKLTTSGTLIKTIRSKYWNKNSNADEGLRKELGLD
ncbi:MAG: hypothetical protein JXR03_05615 [Cyclobacteriaceae bacterium]